VQSLNLHGTDVVLVGQKYLMWL